MKFIYLFLLIFLYFIKRNTIKDAVIAGLIMWKCDVLPYIFPALLIVSIIFKYNLLNNITIILSNIFHINRTRLYMFLISIISGCPSNIKILKEYKKYKYINDDHITSLIASNITFNPLFIIAFTNIKVFIIFTISNLICNFVDKRDIPVFDLSMKNNDSISKIISDSFNVCISILGPIIFASILISLMSSNSFYFKTIFSGVIEITNGLVKNKMYLRNELLSYFFLSFGGLSLFMQIKSILMDAHINYIEIYKFRFIQFLISCTLSLITTCLI